MGNKSELIIYTTDDGLTKVDVKFDGDTVNVEYYNFDVIISVGYRVKSQRGVQFMM